jgi:hypothetical protein
MLVITHALVGGFLTQKISPPFLSYPLVLASHFLMDRLPHWDVGALFSVSRKKMLAVFGAFDLVGALVLSWLVFQKSSPFKPFLWGGVFLSILPDLIEFPVIFFDFRPYPLKKFEDFHSRFFHRKARFWPGLIPQIILVILVLFC